MVRLFAAGLVAAAAFSLAGVAHADQLVLDYQTTLALAGDRAPAAIAARARVREAEARVAGAGVREPTNPELTVEAGPRRRDGASTTDLGIELGQTFELGGRRGARIDAARAGVDQARADLAAARRDAERAAATAFVRALLAGQRLALAKTAAAAADEIAAVTEQRVAKDVAVPLDLSLAQTASGRAHAAVNAAQADREAAIGELRALLGVAPGDPIALRGDLGPRKPAALDALLASARQRPELAALAAEAREGEAIAELGRGLAWPEVRLGARWAREEDARIITGGVTFTLPVLSRGQGERAGGAAQARRAIVEREATARAIDAGVRAAFSVYEQRRAAVDALERDVLPRLDESDRLLAKTYEAGQITIADYLVARRELLDARADYLDRLTELALAGVDLDAAAGVLP